MGTATLGSRKKFKSMTTAVLKLQKTAKIKLESIEAPHLNWKTVCFISFAFFAAVIFFYAYQIVNLTKGYYIVNNYEKKIATLMQENKNLQFNFAESSFLAGVLEKAQALNFERTSSTIKYIQVIDGPVAVK